MRRWAADVKEGEKLEGTVLVTNSRFGIFFDAGLSADVLAPLKELNKPLSEYRQGEVADLIVTKVEGTKITVTTKESAAAPLSKFSKGSTVKAKVVRIVNDIGLFLDIGASKDVLWRTKYLPKPPTDFTVGEEIQGLIITKVDLVKEIIEVSSMAELEERQRQFEGLKSLEDLSVGMKVEGTVSRAMEFGVFVNIGAERDALWALSQLPKPISEYQVGDVVTGLTITDCDPQMKRLSVSTKKSANDFKQGQQLVGRVTQIKPFGIFVDIDASTEALVPVRFLSRAATADYSMGETLTDLEVVSVDTDNNKILVRQSFAAGKGGGEGSDSTARLQMDSLEVGQQVKGVVRMSKPYGIFIDIGLGRRDALLPTALLGGKKASDFKVGDELELFVAQIDKGTERITVSVQVPEFTAFGTGAQFQIAAKDIPFGDIKPDPKSWAARMGNPALIDEEPIDWRAWSEKFPGLIKFAEQETELYITDNAREFSGYAESVKSSVHYLPVPLHLRKPDAAPPVIPPYSFDDFKQDYHYGIKDEIHTQYRKPPMNNPNWTPMKYREEEQAAASKKK